MRLVAEARRSERVDPRRESTRSSLSRVDLLPVANCCGCARTDKLIRATVSPEPCTRSIDSPVPPGSRVPPPAAAAPHGDRDGWRCSERRAVPRRLVLSQRLALALGPRPGPSTPTRTPMSTLFRADPFFPAHSCTISSSRPAQSLAPLHRPRPTPPPPELKQERRPPRQKRRGRHLASIRLA